MEKVKVHLSGIKAAIFDMDGTMVDNSSYHRKAWQEFLNEKGIHLSDEEYNTKISGSNNTEILRNIFGVDLSDEKLQIYAEEKEALYRKLYKDNIQIVEGLYNLLQKLKAKDFRVGIATTAPPANRNFTLDALKIHNEFDLILGDEHITHAKPDPEIYLLAAERLHVQPKNCIVFEDSPRGVMAAKAAGMKVVGILTSHTKEELQDADYTINNFSEIELQ